MLLCVPENAQVHFPAPGATPRDWRGTGAPARLQRTQEDGEAGQCGRAWRVHVSRVWSTEEPADLGHPVDGLRQPLMSSCTRRGLESSCRRLLPLEEASGRASAKTWREACRPETTDEQDQELDVIVGQEENPGSIFAPREVQAENRKSAGDRRWARVIPRAPCFSASFVFTTLISTLIPTAGLSRASDPCGRPRAPCLPSEACHTHQTRSGQRRAAASSTTFSCSSDVLPVSGQGTPSGLVSPRGTRSPP